MPLPVKIKLIPIKDDEPQVLQRPLDCYISDASVKKLQKLWSTTSDLLNLDDPFIAAIAETDDPEIMCEKRNSVFVYCHRLKSTDLNLKEEIGMKTSGGNILDVHVTWSFIEHYSLKYDEERKNLFLVKLDTLHTLKSVIVGEVWDGSKKSRDIPKAGSLVRSSDLFLGKKFSLVIDCSPIAQGLVDESTSITYVSITKSQFKEFLRPRRTPLTPLYTYPESNPTQDGQLLALLLNKVYDDPTVIDSENIVVVSPRVARLLKVTGTEWTCFRAKIARVDSSESEWRFVQIVACNEVQHDNVALLSPQLWFNFVRTIGGKTLNILDHFSLVVCS